MTASGGRKIRMIETEQARREDLRWVLLQGWSTRRGPIRPMAGYCGMGPFALSGYDHAEAAKRVAVP